MPLRRRKAECSKCGYIVSVITELETGDKLADRCTECKASFPRILPPKFSSKYRGRGFTKSNSAPRVK